MTTFLDEGLDEGLGVMNRQTTNRFQPAWLTAPDSRSLWEPLLERTDASLIEQISDEALEAAADMTNQAANTVMCTHLLGCAF